MCPELSNQRKKTIVTLCKVGRHKLKHKLCWLWIFWVFKFGFFLLMGSGEHLEYPDIGHEIGCWWHIQHNWKGEGRKFGGESRL